MRVDHDTTYDSSLGQRPIKWVMVLGQRYWFFQEVHPRTRLHLVWRTTNDGGHRGSSLGMGVSRLRRTNSPMDPHKDHGMCGLPFLRPNIGFFLPRLMRISIARVVYHIFVKGLVVHHFYVDLNNGHVDRPWFLSPSVYPTVDHQIFWILFNKVHIWFLRCYSLELFVIRYNSFL